MADTLQTSIDFARRISGSNSASLTDSKAIDFANDALYDERKAFIKNGVDAGQIQEVYFTPTAGVGTYNYPTAPANPPFFLLKAIEVNFNNTAQNNYLPAVKLDISNLPQGYSWDYFRVNQSAQLPRYNDHGNWFEIFPTPQANMNLTNAIKIVYFIQPTSYVATTDGLAFPESTDPRILGYGIAATYLRSIFKFDQADKFSAQMLSKIADTVPTFGTGGQTPVSPEAIPWTGAEF